MYQSTASDPTKSNARKEKLLSGEDYRSLYRATRTRSRSPKKRNPPIGKEVKTRKIWSMGYNRKAAKDSAATRASRYFLVVNFVV